MGLIDSNGIAISIPSGNSSDLLVATGNLINRLELVTGTIDSSGNYSESGSNYVTPFIDVSWMALPKTLCLTRKGEATVNGAVFAYDSSKAFIKGLTNSSGYITVPAGTAYIRAYLISTPYGGLWIDGQPHNETYPRYNTIGADYVPIDSRWRGKTVAFLGDSFTGMNVYPYVAAGLLEVGDYYCWGQNGCMLNSYSSALDTYLSDLGITMDDLDLIVILGGTNDFSAGYGTTETGSNNGVTVSAANLIEHILGLRADMPIVFGTPTYRYGYNDSTDYDSKGHHISEYAAGIRSTCESYGVPCFDFYQNSGINKVNYATTTRDGLHPTDDKFVEMGRMMAKFIASL